jgi:hypothetical protein
MVLGAQAHASQTKQDTSSSSASKTNRIAACDDQLNRNLHQLTTFAPFFARVGREIDAHKNYEKCVEAVKNSFESYAAVSANQDSEQAGHSTPSRKF